MSLSRNKKAQKYVKGLNPKYQPDYQKIKRKNDPAWLLNSDLGNSSTQFVIITTLLLLASGVRASAQCTPPKGSYQDTCKVSGSTYVSNDPNLKSIEMCKFDLSCQTLDGSYKNAPPVYVQKSMIGCLRFFENCNGNPVIRETNERVCTTKDAIMKESQSRMEL